ncbi:MAG: hypothetical protein GY834_05820 [Bacteroidetes bacterium]|nr:hypothetical protein [Bacteroidota bacterium]
MISSRYKIHGSGYEPTSSDVKSNRDFEPYYLKLNYNYLLKKNLFFGSVASFNGFDGEAELLALIFFVNYLLFSQYLYTLRREKLLRIKKNIVGCNNLICSKIKYEPNFLLTKFF